MVCHDQNNFWAINQLIWFCTHQVFSSNVTTNQQQDMNVSVAYIIFICCGYKQLVVKFTHCHHIQEAGSFIHRTVDTFIGRRALSQVYNQIISDRDLFNS